MPYDTVNRENIQIMVRDFYAIILKDDMLSPFFTKALGDDLNGGKWSEHFNTLDDFWVFWTLGKTLSSKKRPGCFEPEHVFFAHF